MNKRQSTIMELVSEFQEVSVAALVERFGVSEATIRRDLTTLESRGKVVRTFGGARATQAIHMAATSFQERMRQSIPEKKKIAAEALALIRTNMTIALDNGTTTWMVATLLRSVQPLTVVTSSIPIIQAMYDLSETNVISVGGRLRLRNLDFVGSMACDNFRSWHTDIAFVSGNSFRPEQGVYKIEDESAAIVQAMCFSSDMVVALVDHTKINKNVGSYLALDASKLDLLITDRTDEMHIETFDSVPYAVRYA